LHIHFVINILPLHDPGFFLAGIFLIKKSINILKHMKQLLFALTVLLLAACQQPAATTPIETNSAPAVEENYEYAYTIEHPNNWSPGKLENVVLALKALKDFENNDMTACAGSFGDSVFVEFSDYEATLSNDSLKAMFSKLRNSRKTFSIKMDDWESVISKDKNTEYVSLWYKEYWTDLEGKTDSMECMDDMKIKAGKIITLNEKTRHLMAKKQ
jgi:uncharacterized protein YcfL